MTETLEHGYSAERCQQELSNEYQHDRVKMGFKNLCVLVLWMKVASALKSELRYSVLGKATRWCCFNCIISQGRPWFHQIVRLIKASIKGLSINDLSYLVLGKATRGCCFNCIIAQGRSWF